MERNVQYITDAFARLDHSSWCRRILGITSSKQDPRESIGEVDGLGYNLIQFNCFNFVLTEKDYNSHEPDVRKRLKYYTWNSDFHFKAWRYYPGTDLIATGGHKPTFPQDIVEHLFPAKFISRHYMFRSLEHGMRKVFKERLPRYDPEERAIPWHGHYNNLKPDPNYFIADSLKLSKYGEDGRWVLEKKFDAYFGAWKPPNKDDHFSNEDLSKNIDAVRADLQRQFDAIYRLPPIRLYLALKKLLERLQKHHALEPSENVAEFFFSAILTSLPPLQNILAITYSWKIARRRSNCRPGPIQVSSSE